MIVALPGLFSYLFYYFCLFTTSVVVCLCIYIIDSRFAIFVLKKLSFLRPACSVWIVVLLL